MRRRCDTPQDTILRQVERLYDLFDIVRPAATIQEYTRERVNRSPSSLEEDLASRLPLYDKEEEAEIFGKASKILGGVKSIKDARDFQRIENMDPALGKQVKALGLANFQHVLQDRFYGLAGDIMDLSKPYEFPASYESVTPFQLLGMDAVCHEHYDYHGTRGYASLLYHAVRHLDNVTGEETKEELEGTIRRAFEGKKVLELGSGPGFFLYTLRGLGAKVTGVDIREQYRDQINAAGLDILVGDCRDLMSSVGEAKFDIILSMNFLSLGVTRYDAKPIMESAFQALKKGGLGIHQISYQITPEHEYLKATRATAQGNGIKEETLLSNWKMMSAQQKEILLRKNVLNIGLDTIEGIGYKPITEINLDADEYLTLALTR
jgi:SAM-dependent methyltransferase